MSRITQNAKNQLTKQKSKIRERQNLKNLVHMAGLVSHGLGGITNPPHPAIPAPGEIRNYEHIQRQMHERLKQLSEDLSSGNEKVNSHRAGDGYVYISNRVKWQHEFVSTSTNKERVTYDQFLQCSRWLSFARP